MGSWLGLTGAIVFEKLHHKETSAILKNKYSLDFEHKINQLWFAQCQPMGMSMDVSACWTASDLIIAR